MFYYFSTNFVDLVARGRQLHINKFSKLKNEFINCGGFTNESHLGRQLLHYLHSFHTTEVQTMLRNFKPITSRAPDFTCHLVIIYWSWCLKQYEDKNKEFRFTTGGKITSGIANLKFASNTLCKKPLRPRCTQTNCFGPYPAAKCVRISFSHQTKI
ncbi:hypothetical protein VP01_203g5 [Puccinia sorghi]|uniref:Uncharacterized protein n=1 Tax=Puccinia sorghi TaxID=27349 RepID=A0A0L6VBJ3_9BASI|nr:hypothetical protein VP01_203g5 [Puccinia sorghi]